MPIRSQPSETLRATELAAFFIWRASSASWVWIFRTMGFTARKRHCAQRPLLTMLPSFSTPEAAGSTNTSVGILAGSTPGRFQKAPGTYSHQLR